MNDRHMFLENRWGAVLWLIFTCLACDDGNLFIPLGRACAHDHDVTQPRMVSAVFCWSLVLKSNCPGGRIRQVVVVMQHILLMAIFPYVRRWFGNTRVIGQTELARFRDELGSKVADPYTVILKGKKLPMSLLNDPKGSKPNMLQVR